MIFVAVVVVVGAAAVFDYLIFFFIRGKVSRVVQKCVYDTTIHTHSSENNNNITTALASITID